MSTNGWVKIFFAVFGKTVVFYQVLKFLSVSAEELDILWRILMKQLMTIKISERHVSAEQIWQCYVFSRSPNYLEISDISNDHLVAQE